MAVSIFKIDEIRARLLNIDDNVPLGAAVKRPIHIHATAGMWGRRASPGLRSVWSQPQSGSGLAVEDHCRRSLLRGLANDWRRCEQPQSYDRALTRRVPRLVAGTVTSRLSMRLVTSFNGSSS